MSQIYRVYRGHSKEFVLPRQMSAVSQLIASARTSFSSLPGRRNSNVSILSMSERRSFFDPGRRLSDSSLVSDKVVIGKPSSSDNPYLTRREGMFSPIHEHNEDELSESEMHERCNSSSASLTDCFVSSTAKTVAGPSTEECKTKIFYYKSTEV